MLNIGINGRSIFRQQTGVQLYAREITRALCELDEPDVRFTVFTGREGKKGDKGQLPLAISSFPAGGPARGIIWEQALLRRMAARSGIDVLFNPANMAPLYSPVPNVVTIHDLAFLLFPGYFSRSFARYYRETIPRIARKAGAVITVSENTRADLINYLALPPDKVTVVPHGVSTRFRERQERGHLEAVRSRYALPPHYFLSISSLEPRKNLARLIAAYSLLPDEITGEVSLVLAGGSNRIFSDPGILDQVGRAAKGNILTTGYVPDKDIVAIYQMATALVYPSLYEGFGLPVLEAMAASTPVITSNRSSLPEVAGSAAVQVDPENIEEIAAAMELLARDSGTRNLLIERGKKRAAGFTWEKSAATTLVVMRETAAG